MAGSSWVQQEGSDNHVATHAVLETAVAELTSLVVSSGYSRLCIDSQSSASIC